MHELLDTTIHLWDNKSIKTEVKAMGLMKAIGSRFSGTPAQYHKPFSMPAQERLDAILSSTPHGRAIVAARTTTTPATPRPTVAAPKTTTTARPATLAAFTIPTPQPTTTRRFPVRVPVDTSRIAAAQEPRNTPVVPHQKRTRHAGSKAFGMTVAQFTAAQKAAMKWNDSAPDWDGTNNGVFEW
jgi:hypothetical protein